ncbi:MAG: hypothetical protein ACRCX4_11410 [Bacteroidales bacterium]
MQIRFTKKSKLSGSYMGGGFSGGGSTLDPSTLKFVPYNPDNEAVWDIPDKPVNVLGLTSNGSVIAIGDIVANKAGAVTFTATDEQTGSQYLYQLLDVDIPNPANGDALVYNGNKWSCTQINRHHVGLGNVDNTSDIDKPVSTATLSALSNKVDKVPNMALSSNDFTSVHKSKLDGIESGAQVNKVTSVAGKEGDVTLSKADVNLGNVDNTSDANKPISTATQTALNGKLGKTETASDSHKLGGRASADFYHKANSNLPSVDWAAKNVVAAGDIVAKKTNAVVFAASDTSGGSQYLHQLLDVEIPTPKNGDILVYNGSKQKWSNVSEVIFDAGNYAII